MEDPNSPGDFVMKFKFLTFAKIEHILMDKLLAFTNNTSH